MRKILFLVSGLLCLVFARGLPAQILDQAVSVPVIFEGEWSGYLDHWYDNNENIQYTYPELLGTISAESAVTITTTGTYNAGLLAKKVLMMKPGKSYTVAFEGTQITNIIFDLSPPVGYRVIIDNQNRRAISADLDVGVYRIMVESSVLPTLGITGIGALEGLTNVPDAPPKERVRFTAGDRGCPRRENFPSVSRPLGSLSELPPACVQISSAGVLGWAKTRTETHMA